MKKIRFTLLVLFLLCIGTSLIAQTKITLKGEVVDKDNQPVIGAAIVEKGTTNGTVSNIDGKFVLNVSTAKSTLRVSCIGYEKVEIAASSVAQTGRIKIQESSVALNEVVTIGYGVVKKNDATGSVTAIKPDKLNRGLTTNAQDMIAGKIAGVVVTSDGGTPGGSATIRIRGGSSLSASNDPLIVIDGLTMDGGVKGVANALSAVNPSDIESFTVLKDASATAIYGSRASNGVIIITTKKGQKGAKARVSYDGNFSISRVKNTLDVLNGDQYRDLIKKVYATDPSTIAKLGTENTDWQKEIYQDGLSQDHNINIMGGLKNMPYRFSLGYTNQNGIVKTSSFERYTASFNLSPSFFKDYLKMNINGKGMYVRNRYADGGAVGSASSMDPTQPVYASDPIHSRYFGGYFQWYAVDKNKNKADKNDTIITNSLAVKNPVAMLNQKNDVAKSKDFIGSADIDYKFHFLPDLKAHLSVGMEASTGKQDLYIEPTAASDLGYGRTGWIKEDKTNSSLNSYLQYTKQISKHNFDLMAGYEWQHFYRSGSSEYQGLTKNVYNTTLKDTVGFNYVANAWKTESYLVSFFGRFNYSYDNKYLATFTLRDDGTSRFSPSNRWGLFPAGALAWKINEEEFLKGKDIFTDLKVRLGYGITGQQNLGLGDYPYIPVYQNNINGAYYVFDSTYVNTSRPDAYNSKLKWEQTTTYNAGLDFGLLNSRITGSVDYYFRETKDLLNVVDVPAGSNFKNRVVSNIGSLQNKGVEFSISVKPISNKNCTWEIGYNVTYNENKITALTLGARADQPIATGGISSGVGSNIQAYAIGYPTNSFYVYHQAYDSITGKPLEGTFIGKDGKITTKPGTADLYYYKKPAADVTMGLSSKFIYKNFDFSFSLRGSIGNYVYNDVAASRSNLGIGSVFYSNSFTNRPVSALYTDFKDQKTFLSDYYVENASFIRCDNITVGYSFKKLSENISSGRIFATIQNPFVITKYSGLDPELFGGIDNNIYPRPIVTLVGLSLTF